MGLRVCMATSSSRRVHFSSSVVCEWWPGEEEHDETLDGELDMFFWLTIAIIAGLPIEESRGVSSNPFSHSAGTNTGPVYRGWGDLAVLVLLKLMNSARLAAARVLRSSSS